MPFCDNLSIKLLKIISQYDIILKLIWNIMFLCKGDRYMKVTGIVRRVDDLGRIVIPKEIRRTLKIREGDPLLTTLTPIDRFLWAIHSAVNRYKK